jgi:thioredoxin-like negative regulator of GroEL
MAKEIGDEALRAAQLEMLAPIVALVGALDTAVAIINELAVQSFERNAAIRLSTSQLLAAGEFEKARHIAELFDHPPHRADLFGQIAEELTRDGDVDSALALIEEMESAREGSRALAEMVAILSDSGQRSDAQRVADLIDDDLDAAAAGVDLARAHARAQDFEAAHAVADRIGVDSYQQSALRHIARAEADAGLFEGAAATTERINHHRYRPEALGHLAARLAAAGRLQEAQALAAGLADQDARDQARARIAVALVGSAGTQTDG